jgi:hypothetical protein
MEKKRGREEKGNRTKTRSDQDWSRERKGQIERERVRESGDSREMGSMSDRPPRLLYNCSPKRLTQTNPGYWDDATCHFRELAVLILAFFETRINDRSFTFQRNQTRPRNCFGPYTLLVRADRRSPISIKLISFNLRRNLKRTVCTHCLKCDCMTAYTVLKKRCQRLN